MGRKREAQTGGAGYSKAFPTRLRGLLKDSQTTQAALAEHLGIARQSVAAYCSGESTPSWEGIAKIAGFFGCSSDYLLGLSEYRFPSTEKITLARLGMNESTIKHLKDKCELPPPLLPLKWKKTQDTRRGINLLLGNDLIWSFRVFPEIARLEKLVSELKKGDMDTLRKRKISVVTREMLSGDIEDDFSFSPMDYLDFCINRLEGWFSTCVEDAIGYNQLYEKVYGETEE